MFSEAIPLTFHLFETMQFLRVLHERSSAVTVYTYNKME